MASQAYIVHHHYDAEKDDELTLEVGDIIKVSDKSDPGWWVGEKAKDGKVGWFPSNFVDPYKEPVAEVAAASQSTEATPAPAADATPTVSDDTPSAPKSEGPILARVEYDYEAKESGELSLEVGRVVTILDSSDPAWWNGDLNGKIGTFPSNYVKLIEHREEEATEDKPTKFRLAAFGVKQGGLGSLFAGGVVPGLKKTGGLKKLAGVDAPAATTGSAPKRNSIDEPRSPGFSAPVPKATVPPPITEEPQVPLTNPAPILAAPTVPVEVAPAAAVVSQEPRVPSRAKKPKAKQIKALVIYEYTAQEDDEISLAKGSTIVVTDKLGDEGWWTGRNEQGEIGNFPSDFVQEIKETIQSPPLTPATPVQHEEPPQSPVQSHPSVTLPAAPLRVEPVHGKTIEGPLATPPPLPRGSRPQSIIAPPTPSAHLHDARAMNDGPPLPGSPPLKRMSIVSHSSSADYPASPRQATAPSSSSMEPPSPTTSVPGDLSRSSTLRRPQKPIPEAPLSEADEIQYQEPTETSDTSSSNSNRNSYILPTPVSRNRSLPPLARPPSIHQAAENRKSVVIPPTTELPSVPSEPEEVVQEINTALEKLEEEKEEHMQEQAVEAPQEQVHIAQVESPEEVHVEPEHQNAILHEEPTLKEPAAAVADIVADEVEEVVEDIQQETPQEQAEVEAEEAAVEEKELEKPKLPEMESSGPALSHASRPRPAKGRKPPSAPVSNTEASFVSQLEAEVKATPIVEEKKPEPIAAPISVIEKAAPPPKPMKPIFQKFPTPFAGAQPAAVSLRPTGRRAGSGESATSIGSDSASASNSSSPAPTSTPAGGVKSLSSRFGQFQGVPASGASNTAALELEIAKLRRFMNEELDRVRKELADERESREKLQEEVSKLKAQLQD
ncbi:SH3-domain kinase binding protein 1 [Mortierella sp. AM989]|nr:SH3-domain kinase binding protein 1 [Mortierella sp. AM989]